MKSSLRLCFNIVLCNIAVACAEPVLAAEGQINYTAASPTIAQQRTDANSLAAHNELIAKAHAGTIDIYFIGDSITRRWGALDYPEFLANWNRNFHGWNAADFGWGGDRTQNMLWRLENGEFAEVQPKIVVIQAGTNNLGDIAGDQAQIDSISAGIKALIDAGRARAPQAIIVVTGVFLRSDKPQYNAVINGINSKLAALADGNKLRFVNLNSALADANGQLAKEMSVDGLHLSVQAYQLWADTLKPVFTAILGAPAVIDHAPPPTGDQSAKKG
jgi:lysophospholipase L1-like esterase